MGTGDGRIVLSRWFRTKEIFYDNSIQIAKKSLTLYDTIVISFKVPAAVAEWYEDPFLEVTQNGKKSVNDCYDVSSDGEYLIFNVRVAPQEMGDVIRAVPCAYNTDRDIIVGEPVEYSVAEYCKNMLENEKYQSDEWNVFRRLLVDILHYGDAAQTYVNYKTDSLVSAFLSEEQRSMGTDVTIPMVYNTVKDKDYATVSASVASIDTAALYLEAAVNVQFKITARNPAGLRAVMSDSENFAKFMGTASLSADCVDENGRYVVRFDGLNAGQMRKTIYAVVIQGKRAVSNTYRYSIESYVAAMKGKGVPNLDNLLDAMMRYGDSAAAFVGNN